MVKDRSINKRGNPLPPHGLLFPISSNCSFICIIPQTGSHKPYVLLHQSWITGWNEWVHHEGSIRRPIAPFSVSHVNSIIIYIFIYLLTYILTYFGGGVGGLNYFRAHIHRRFRHAHHETRDLLTYVLAC